MEKKEIYNSKKGFIADTNEKVGKSFIADAPEKLSQGFVDAISHNNDIVQSRTGGFGGSDAEMFYRIGLKGLSALTQRDKKRIRVAKGIDKYVPIMQTEAMTRGHEFEQWFWNMYNDSVKKGYAKIWFRDKYNIYNINPCEVEREKLLTSKLARNFDIFAHADFYSIEGDTVYELKCTSDTMNAAENNLYQLQWYYMLGVKNVILVIHDSALDFNVGNMDMQRIYSVRPVIDLIKHGIKLLDESWNELDLTLSDELTEDDLMPYERREIDVLYKYLKDIEMMEKETEDKKKKLLQMMRENNIKSIKSDRYNIAYVPEGTRASFDKKKLFKEHPELNESDYTILVPRADYLTITLK